MQNGRSFSLIRPPTGGRINENTQAKRSLLQKPGLTPVIDRELWGKMKASHQPMQALALGTTSWELCKLLWTFRRSLPTHLPDRER